MPSARSLTDRLRRLAPEAFAFGVIGAGNTLLYMAITWVAMPIGVVKANVLASVVTTTLAYLANRYWTYRHHTRSALRREYTLFFGFNMIGLVIQSGAVGIAKYGFGFNEVDHKVLLMVITLAAAGFATVFRFWAYRTFVFLKPPVDGHEAAIAELDVAAGLAELSVEEELDAAPLTAGPDLDAELAEELDAQRAERR
jgi:putative flippase GtrA